MYETINPPFSTLCADARSTRARSGSDDDHWPGRITAVDSEIPVLHRSCGSSVNAAANSLLRPISVETTNIGDARDAGAAEAAVDAGDFEDVGDRKVSGQTGLNNCWLSDGLLGIALAVSIGCPGHG